MHIARLLSFSDHTAYVQVCTLALSFAWYRPFIVYVLYSLNVAR